jgi:hypothetical protein
MTSASVAYGRASSRDAKPGRSARSARSGRSRGGRFSRLGFCFFGLGSETVPSRSIFGARFRRRVPQYGHSVM